MELGDLIKRVQELERRMDNAADEQKQQVGFNHQVYARLNNLKAELDSLLEALKIVRQKTKQKIITRF